VVGTPKRHRTRHRTFGTVRRLPSGNYQARWSDPTTGRQESGPTTFQTRADANAWLAARQTDLARRTWVPGHSSSTFGDYAKDWLELRELKPRTRSEYAALLDGLILPTFATMRLGAITPQKVRDWHADLGKQTGPTRRAHAYALLRTILGTAVTEDLLAANPCRVRGAGRVKRAKTIRPATLEELETITTAMPDHLRPTVLLASWCALRFGEIAELRRKDVDLRAGVLRIRRGVTRVAGGAVVGEPKSTAGMRDVAIPPHLIPVMRTHLKDYAQPGPDGLLFPAEHGGHINPSTLYGSFYPARHLAGRDDLRFHDLRHTGAVLAASTGATLAELMARLGHTTPAMAMRYQHAAAERDREIAQRLTQIALGGAS